MRQKDWVLVEVPTTRPTRSRASQNRNNSTRDLGRRRLHRTWSVRSSNGLVSTAQTCCGAIAETIPWCFRVWVGISMGISKEGVYAAWNSDSWSEVHMSLRLFATLSFAWRRRPDILVMDIFLKGTAQLDSIFLSSMRDADLIRV